jgi:hypothetical protein
MVIWDRAIVPGWQEVGTFLPVSFRIGTVECRRAAIAEAVMHVLRDGVDDAVRLRGADQSR